MDESVQKQLERVNKIIETSKRVIPDFDSIIKENLNIPEIKLVDVPKAGDYRPFIK